MKAFMAKLSAQELAPQRAVQATWDAAVQANRDARAEAASLGMSEACVNSLNEIPAQCGLPENQPDVNVVCGTDCIKLVADAAASCSGKGEESLKGLQGLCSKSGKAVLTSLHTCAQHPFSGCDTCHAAAVCNVNPPTSGMPIQKYFAMLGGLRLACASQTHPCAEFLMTAVPQSCTVAPFEGCRHACAVKQACKGQGIPPPEVFPSDLIEEGIRAHKDVCDAASLE